MEVTARLLPSAEWSRLPVPELAAMDPAHGQVIAVEQDGRVVACWGILMALHVEGLHIEPSHRHHAGVARALLTKMVETLKTWGAGEVLTQALTQDVETLLEKAGGRVVPGRTWVIPVTDLEGVVR